MTADNFLNNSLTDFLAAIQGTWSATIQIYGVKILLMLLVVSLGINWIYAISQRDAGRLLDSTVNSLVSAGVLYTITFQAPGLFVRHGWEEFGRIECDPPGTARVFLRKSFDAATGSDRT